MKQIAALIFIIFIQATGYCQKRISSYAECSVVIARVGNEWKADSLGSNGFRISVFKEVRFSKIDTVSKEFLFRCLGKPVRAQKFYSGITNKNYVGYIYYVLNMNSKPEERPYQGIYIEFVFDENERALQYIDDGDYCG